MVPPKKISNKNNYRLCFERLNKFESKIKCFCLIKYLCVRACFFLCSGKQLHLQATCCLRVYSNSTRMFRGQILSGLDLFVSSYSPGEKNGKILSVNRSVNVCIVVRSVALMKTTFPLS